MEFKAVIINGEASESDEESINIKTEMPFSLIPSSSSCKTIIPKKAKPIDDENCSTSNTSNIVDAGICSYTDVKGCKRKKNYVKYNSLLHKKLLECNKLFDKDIQELLNTTIFCAVEELNNTNKQLLKSEFILQETISKFQGASIQFEETLNSLHRILDEDFFQSIKL